MSEIDSLDGVENIISILLSTEVNPWIRKLSIYFQTFISFRQLNGNENIELSINYIVVYHDQT